MIERIYYSDEFDASFKRLKKRYRSLPDDFKALLLSLCENPQQGVALSNGRRKVRLAITSKGKGKRSGARVIIKHAILNDTDLAFLYIYDKSDMENVSDQYLDSIIIKVENGEL